METRMKKNNKKRKRENKHIIESTDKHDDDIHSFVELPLDILLHILARLPVKSILRCKCVSRLFNHLISNPTFSNIYRNNSSRLTAILYPLLLIEFDTSRCLMSQTILPPPPCINPELDEAYADIHKVYSEVVGMYSEVVGCCDGIVLLLKFEGTTYDLFLGNPILGEFIRLPQSIAFDMRSFLAFGLGYCQHSNKYKVLRIITEYVEANGYRNRTEIFTVGLDEKWRSVEDDNVPYNMESGIFTPPYLNTHMMIAFNSGLHWLVQRVSLPFCKLEPKWGGNHCICAFDLEEERASAIPLPRDTALCDCYNNRFARCRCQLGVILGKLCLCNRNSNQLNVWVMVEYGNASSWTKQFILKTSVLPDCVVTFKLTVSSVLDEGVIVLSDLERFVFYDLIRKKTLMVFHRTKLYHGPMVFYPSFVSLSKLGRSPQLRILIAGYCFLSVLIHFI